MDKSIILKELYHKTSKTKLYDVTTYKYGSFTSGPLVCPISHKSYIKLELNKNNSILLYDFRYLEYMEINDIIYLNDKLDYINSEIVIDSYHFNNFDIYELMCKEKNKYKEAIYRIYIPNDIISSSVFDHYRRKHIYSDMYLEKNNITKKTIVDVPYFKNNIKLLYCEEYRKL